MWSKLCKNKKEGGLGFRDLSHFNKALLTKQGWRLITNLKSLVAVVLKHIYFPNSFFLQAKAKASFSFVWRSIVWGKNLLDKGVRWRVGNGETISIYNDKWLSRPLSFRVISPHVLDGN
ncbi:hypothetical protein ACOSP7_020519 [Xanthoceras sorbifolium]